MTTVGLKDILDNRQTEASAVAFAVKLLTAFEHDRAFLFWDAGAIILNAHSPVSLHCYANAGASVPSGIFYQIAQNVCEIGLLHCNTRIGRTVDFKS